MNIIVAGDGKVGLAITRLLSQEGHDIVAIDTNSQQLEEQLQRLDVMSVQGNCATMETLREANVEQSDILIAATSADETNLLCCCMLVVRLAPVQCWNFCRNTFGLLYIFTKN